MFRLTILFAVLGCALAGVIEPFGGRIVGGVETNIEKFPYQVSLQKGGSHFCGGSLIAPDTIVSAAHCLQSVKAAELKVRLGSSFYKSGGELITVKAFKNHELYDSSKHTFDVAVIKLSSPVTYSAKIQPIELADVVPSSGTPGVVTGWGTNKFLVGNLMDQLQEVDVDIVTMKDCSSEKYKYGQQVQETMVCATIEGGGKDACQGDSGGPLAAGKKLVGVVSWGNMCGRKDYPGVYASVPDVHTWIIETALKM